MWQEFVDSTTLHGLKFIFIKRHILVRLIWVVLLMTSAGYYISTVYRAFNKYYSRQINTVVSKKYLKEMDFPAVTICSLNDFAKSKLYMKDDDPHFRSSGLNISSFAVTSKVRQNQPCGWSVLCTLPDYENLTLAMPNSTDKYKQELVDAMQQVHHSVDMESFYQYYSQDINALIGSSCMFNLFKSCSAKDFVPAVTPWGMCYTFNPGTAGKIKNVDTGGISFGLFVMLDAQTHEYSFGKYSVGFKVLIHRQREFIDPWEGINVGPGQHAVIALTQARVGFFCIPKNFLASIAALKCLPHIWIFSELHLIRVQKNIK